MRIAVKIIGVLVCFLLLVSAESCRSKKRRANVKLKSGAVKTGTVTTPQHSGTISNKDIELLVRTAKSYIGTPYKYGGITRNGMDCSGLMHTTFKAINKSIPRNSQEQATIGKEISIKELRVGDLVFFGDKRLGKGITHVGMVTSVADIKTNIKFIHASTKLGVIENNLYAEYYFKTFVKAVRP